LLFAGGGTHLIFGTIVSCQKGKKRATVSLRLSVLGRMPGDSLA
jgi:hypothetical protein